MKKKNDNGFLVSCIIPCYNVGLYVEEAIKSIIKQTIGFKNIELIIVNDGSTDNTGEIIEKYASKYSNIVYINQKNSGVSESRNNGVKVATGKYLAFLDGDDKWDITAFDEGVKMLDKHKEINFAAFRVHQFEAVDNYHVLDYKFDKNKIVAVFKDITMVQTQIASVMFRTDFIKKYKFDSKIKYSEDAKFINDMVFDSPKFGIISTSCYQARKRANQSSTVQGCLKNKDWYTVTISDVYEYLANKSIEKYGKIIDYIQLVILYEFQWRFFTKREDITLNDKDFKKYYKSISDLVKRLDDKNILLAPGANDYKKRKILEIKYDGNIYDKFSVKDNSICLEDTKVIDKKDLSLRLEGLKITKYKIRIKLKFNMFVTSDLYIYVNGKKIKCEKEKADSNLVYDEKEYFVDILNYETRFLLRKKLNIYTLIDNKKCYYDIKFSSAINESLKTNGYYKTGRGKLYYKNNKMIIKR